MIQTTAQNKVPANQKRFACGRHTLTLGQRTLVMGILNITPDSFSDGGRFLDLTSATEQALQMVEEGADLIDVGGESTRPGANAVSIDEELARVVPVIEKLSSQLSVPISVDTRKAKVASYAIQAGASLVNDVSALTDPEMASVVASAKVPVVLMHMRGEPNTMQRDVHYENVVKEVTDFLLERASVAEAAGVARELILLDPGIGFGKNLDHNLQLLAHLDQLTKTGYPVVVGPSRKSFIGQVLNREVDGRLMGTATAVAWAAMHGAAMVRVHDVGAMGEVTKLISAIGESR